MTVVDGIAPGLTEKRTPRLDYEIMTDAFTHQTANGCGHLADFTFTLGRHDTGFCPFAVL